MNSLYGRSDRTRTFADIFGSLDIFIEAYKNNGIKSTISDENVSTLYYLLYGQYGNSHIANSDENQFKYKLFSIIFMYGPSWEKRLEIQENLRKLSNDELLLGAKQIYNHSFNPSSAPSTSSLEELETINEQNTSNYKRSKLDAYALLWDLLKSDVTNAFISKFKDLFKVIVEPELPLWYETEIGDE